MLLTRAPEKQASRSLARRVLCRGAGLANRTPLMGRRPRAIEDTKDVTLIDEADEHFACELANLSGHAGNRC